MRARSVLEGIDVVADPERAKPQLSYMPQRFGLYEDLTVAENIFFYAELFARAAQRAPANAPPELLEAAGARCRSAAASPASSPAA